MIFYRLSTTPAMHFSRFKISNLLHALSGTEEEHELSEKATDLTEEDPQIISPVSFRVTFLKGENRIEASFRQVETKVITECMRCLKKITQDISIPFFAYTYLIEGGGFSESELLDNFMVDAKTNTIDVSEPLRDEILLATETFALCKPDCKGLCSQCGKDLNLGKCRCAQEESKDPDTEKKTYKPFADLKKIIKK